MEDPKAIISILTELLGERTIRVGRLYHGRGMAVREIADKMQLTRAAVKRDLRAIARIALSARQGSRRSDRAELLASLN